MGGSSKGGGGQAYSGPTEAELAARRAEERAEAALILGEAEIQGFYQPVEELLKDKSLNL